MSTFNNITLEEFKGTIVKPLDELLFNGIINIINKKDTLFTLEDEEDIEIFYNIYLEINREIDLFPRLISL